jgi:hypothetical protein
VLYLINETSWPHAKHHWTLPRWHSAECCTYYAEPWSNLVNHTPFLIGAKRDGSGATFNKIYALNSALLSSDQLGKQIAVAA